MEAHYYIYNIVSYGIILLLVYMFVDIFFDSFRKVEKPAGKRMLLYSFLFYCLCLLQIKLGGIVLPLQKGNDFYSTYISTESLFAFFETTHFTIRSLSSFGIWGNLLLFFPLGVYVAILFQVRQLREAVAVIIMSCLGIELLRYVLGGMELVMSGGSVNILTVLFALLHIIGGVAGFYLVKRSSWCRTSIFKRIAWRAE